MVTKLADFIREKLHHHIHIDYWNHRRNIHPISGIIHPGVHHTTRDCDDRGDGFTITFKTFGTAIKDIKSFLFGLSLNFVLAPLLCWLLALLLLRNLSQLATGLILIGVVPCAGMVFI